MAGSIRPATVLSPCDNERLPFRWTLNPYRGCAFACRYCYARYTHEWLGLDPGRGFDEEVLLKEDLAETLARDLARMRRRGRLGEAIAVGTATDPYQPAEHRFGLTRSCLEVLAEEEGHRLSITTTSDLVLRDIDILLGIGERNELRVNVTLTALDCSLARRLEPGAPSPRTRLSTIAALARGGVAVDTFVMPILPGITDGEAELDALFEAIALAGARAAHCQALFLRSPSREVFFAFLERRFPERLLEYRRLFGDNAHPPPLTVARLRARVERLRERHGLHGGPRSPSQRLPRRRRRRSPPQAPP
ncbi:MAG: radical SAM protein, partial [Planctomycetota bacterium]